jgi:carboxymethylenebutenolidase
VFAAFGAEDHIISVDDVRRFRNTLEDAKKSYDIRIYAGAPHGWLNDTMPGRYRKPQAEAAWAAQQAFLSKVMSGAMPKDVISWTFESGMSTSYDFSKNRRLE